LTRKQGGHDDRPEETVNENELVKQLKQWRETRTRKAPQQPTAADRRMVRVNGQDVVVVTKARKVQG